MDRKLDGYTLLHGIETSGSNPKFFGLHVYAKMHGYEITRDDYFDEDVYAACEALEKALRLRWAKNEPEGPSKRAACRKQIEDIYLAAGVPAIFVEEIPNGYCKQPCCHNLPWFVVTSPVGRIEIGWRKSVMSIEWKGTTVKQSGNELFPDEDVTKWETGIHAWSPLKATEYLRRLHTPTPRP